MDNGLTGYCTYSQQGVLYVPGEESEEEVAMDG